MLKKKFGYVVEINIYLWIIDLVCILLFMIFYVCVVINGRVCSCFDYK